MIMSDVIDKLHDSIDILSVILGSVNDIHIVFTTGNLYIRINGKINNVRILLPVGRAEFVNSQAIAIDGIQLGKICRELICTFVSEVTRFIIETILNDKDRSIYIVSFLELLEGHTKFIEHLDVHFCPVNIQFVVVSHIVKVAKRYKEGITLISTCGRNLAIIEFSTVLYVMCKK